MHPVTVLIWALLGCVVLSVGGIFTTLVLSNHIELFPDEKAAATPAATTTPIVDTGYGVLVLNGTAEQGLASETKAAIVAAGWPDSAVEAGESSSTDFANTVVYYGAPEDRAAALGLAAVIGVTATEQSDAYQLDDDPSTTDVVETGPKRLVLVIGQDRVAPKPSPAAS